MDLMKMRSTVVSELNFCCCSCFHIFIYYAFVEKIIPKCIQAQTFFFSVSRTCRDGYFSCGNGPCVPLQSVCDRHPNCPNFQDEKNCTCTEDEIRCESSGLCIAADLKCDHDPDCPDASDEMGCGKWDIVIRWTDFLILIMMEKSLRDRQTDRNACT